MVYYKQNGGLYLFRGLYANPKSDKLLKKSKTLRPSSTCRTYSYVLERKQQWSIVPAYIAGQKFRQDYGHLFQ